MNFRWSFVKCALQVPTLFLGGAESDYIPVADHEEIREQFPQARYRVKEIWTFE